MVLVAVYDEVGALMLVEQLVIGEDAGELEDAVGEGIQAAHLEVDPQVVRNEIDTHCE